MMTGTSGRAALAFRQEFETTHAWHIDIGHNEDQSATILAFDASQRASGRLCKVHDEPSGAKLAPELLAKQHFHIDFVVHHQDEMRHACPPPSCAPVRGRIILNSVKQPTSVSTSIVPACCLTTMSWLSDRPIPVPSPAGFVVKNGLKILSFTSGGMPVPLSLMRISTRSPRSFVLALSVGSKVPSASCARRFVAA